MVWNENNSAATAVRSMIMISKQRAMVDGACLAEFTTTMEIIETSLLVVVLLR